MVIDSHHEVITLEQWFLHFSLPQKPPVRLVITPIVGPHPRVSDSVGLRRGLRICISIKFLGAANTVDLEITLLEPMY